MNNATTFALAALENSRNISLIRSKLRSNEGFQKTLEDYVIAEGVATIYVNWVEVGMALLRQDMPPLPISRPAPLPYPVTPVPQTPTQPTNTGNIDMSKVFTSENYVYGQAVSQMSDEQLISAINRVNGEIKALTSVEADSAKIKAKVAELEAGKASIVAALDGDVTTSKKSK